MDLIISIPLGSAVGHAVRVRALYIRLNNYIATVPTTTEPAMVLTGGASTEKMWEEMCKCLARLFGGS